MKIFLFLFMAAVCIAYGETLNIDDLTARKDGHWIVTKTSQPFTGTLVRRYPSGAKKTEENYLNGKWHGVWKEWYPSGNLCIVDNYDNDRLDGLSLFYYKSGGVHEKTFRVHDSGNNFIEHSILYHENGNVKEEVISVNRRKVGNTYEYNEKGELSGNTLYKIDISKILKKGLTQQ